MKCRTIEKVKPARDSATLVRSILCTFLEISGFNRNHQIFIRNSLIFTFPSLAASRWQEIQLENKINLVLSKGMLIRESFAR